MTHRLARPSDRSLRAGLRRRELAALALAGLWPVARAATSSEDADGALLRAAIAGPQRSANYRARDGARHPYETLRFFGLKPSMTVVEIAPGGGWYTEILAPYLRENGKLYTAHNAKDAKSEEARKGRERFEAKLAASPAVYDRVVVGTLPTDSRGFFDIAPPGGADAVFTFRNIHNWHQAGHLDATLNAFFAVLKPGGILGVEEHRAPPGISLAKSAETGYMAEAFVIERARAAGFGAVTSSEVNANPRDDKDHPNGVWSLPPTLEGGDVDRDKFLAIGESDRMTLRFVKPLA